MQKTPYPWAFSYTQKTIAPILKLYQFDYAIWFHATPAPINSFLESYDLIGKLIIPFCTSGGSDIDETMPTFLDSCKGLAVYGECRISGNAQISGWLTELDLNLGNHN